MGLSDLTDRGAVLRAIAECDRLGRAEFREEHGFGAATGYVLEYKGHEYDSKAIAGVAHGYQFPELGPLPSAAFSGGKEAAARKLIELGFEVVGPGEPSSVLGLPPVGSTFASRAEARAAGVHRYLINGIDYERATGLSTAIVLNGGYKDDQDLGDVIIYTGEGGQNANRTEQVQDQDWSKGNGGLRNAQTAGEPVRILRGFKPKNPFSPATGYCYDGLYTVVSADLVPSSDGPLVCQFRLEAIPGESTSFGAESDHSPPEDPPPTDEIDALPGRAATTVMRIIRDSLISRRLKHIHEFGCQICGIRLATPSGPYAEGAHIRPLGQPHDGPDTLENLLCLCPNHHVLFDKGAVWVGEDFVVRATNGGEVLGPLLLAPTHQVSADHLAYHHERIAR